jgi:hypothetical protein
MSSTLGKISSVTVFELFPSHFLMEFLHDFIRTFTVVHEKNHLYLKENRMVITANHREREDGGWGGGGAELWPLSSRGTSQRNGTGK